MKLLEIHRALFSHDKLTKPLSAFFENLKQSHPLFRKILRVIQAGELETILYGNKTDTLPISFEFVFSSHYLAEINELHQYLQIDIQNKEIFRSIYYLLHIVLLPYSSSHLFNSHFLQKYLIAYRLLVCFGDHDLESTLNNIDHYCYRNSLNENELADHFSFGMRKPGTPIQLNNWRTFIAENPPTEALRIFNLNVEIEKILGRAPSHITEADQAIVDSAKSTMWSRRELIYILLQLSNKLQLDFINALSETHLTILVGTDYQSFVTAISLVENPHNQEALLKRLPTELLRSPRFNDIKQKQIMIKVVDPSNISTFLKLNDKSFLEEITNDFELLTFLRKKLPKTYNKEEFLTEVLGREKLNSLLRYPLLLRNLLEEFIPTHKRFDFLFNFIGKEKIRELIINDKYGFDLQVLLDTLPPHQSFKMIEEIFSPQPNESHNEKLRSIRNNNASYWRIIKSTVRTETNRKKLHQWIYSKEELTAKETLKNIKKTIRSPCTWSFGLFESPQSVDLGRTRINVPSIALSHIKQFRLLSAPKKSPIDALEEIKRSGKEIAATYQTFYMNFSNLFYDKSPTQDYFENFSSEEKFNEAFAPKKSK